MEGIRGDGESRDLSHLSVGRGRGFLFSTPQTGRNVMFASPEFTRSGKYTTSPDNTYERDTADLTMSGSHINDLIQQIGSEIGASIRASLSRSSDVEPGSQAHHEPTTTASGSGQLNTTVIDASKLNLVLKSDVSTPPYFRGDSSDRCTIYEWEELMRAYLSKRDLPNSELVGEILNRLMGRARDITKVWIRNNSGVVDVNAVFTILRQHFSESVSSGLPLADFYAVKPHASENPLDYWVRLNKAAEVVEQSLRSEGRAMFNRSMELAVMFIQNCPDKDLALVFKSKAMRTWTASEVQEHLDEFLRERKTKKCQLKLNVMGVAEEFKESEEHVLTNSSPNSHNCELEQMSCAAEKTTLDRVLNMLEKALVSNSQSARQTPTPTKGPRQCKVCGSSEHTTNVHCRMYKLCFKCFSPEHVSFNCVADAGKTANSKRSGQNQEN